MYRCEVCGTVFEKPEQYELWSRHEINKDILLLCPNCHDDRITYLWSEDLKSKGEEEQK